MNTNRCSLCTRRKPLLAKGYFRRWVHSVECQHGSKWENESDSLEDCFIAENNISDVKIPKSKFVKFWKKKAFSVQKYFVKKRGDGNTVSNIEFTFNVPIDRGLKSNLELEVKNSESNDSLLVESYHCSAYRGHHKHVSAESCAVYCQLAKHGWYWGGITSREAEELLAGQHDNVFLVRDSYNSRHLLCVSFRCVGKTLHARLRHANGLFSLNNEAFVSANNISKHCTSVAVMPNKLRPAFTVKLALPLNRFAQLDSLQKICRYILRQAVPRENLKLLPLPQHLVRYITLGSDYIIPRDYSQ